MLKCTTCNLLQNNFQDIGTEIVHNIHFLNSGLDKVTVGRIARYQWDTELNPCMFIHYVYRLLRLSSLHYCISTYLHQHKHIAMYLSWRTHTEDIGSYQLDWVQHSSTL